MKSLFLILYVSGKIGGVWGPLPYGMEECRDTADALMEEIGEKAAEKAVDVADWKFACEYRTKAPKLWDEK